MENKRGQFYIIAAIIIVTILIGSTSIVSYAKLSKRPKNIESLGQELNEEGSRIVSHGISPSPAIKNAIKLAHEFYLKDFNEILKKEVPELEKQLSQGLSTGKRIWRSIKGSLVREKRTKKDE